MDTEAHVQALESPPTPTLEDTFDKLGKHFSLVGPSLFGAGAEARWGAGRGLRPRGRGAEWGGASLARPRPGSRGL